MKTHNRYIFVLMAALAVLPRLTRYVEAQINHDWNFTNVADYVVSDRTLIEVDPTPPGRARLILQAITEHHADRSDYLAGTLENGRIGPDKVLRLIRQAGGYAERGEYISRVHDLGAGNEWWRLQFGRSGHTFMNNLNEIPSDYPGLVALYHLNNNMLDAVTEEEGTMGSGGSYNAEAMFGSHAASFTGGGNSHADTVNSSLLHGESEATIAVWVKFRDWGDWAGIIYSRGSTRSSGLHQGGPPGYIQARGNFSDGFSNTDIVGPLDLYRWYHLAMTVKSGDFTRLYIDGELVNMATEARNGTLIQEAAYRLAWDSFSSARRSDCLIDEVAIFDRALPPEEILALYRRQRAARIQLRSSADSPPAGEFTGPDGTGDSYYLADGYNLAAAGSFDPADRYLQYRLDMNSDAYRRHTPFVTAVTLSGSHGSSADYTRGDFLDGTSFDNVAAVPDWTDWSYLGLSKHPNGGYPEEGFYRSAVITNPAAGSASWDEIAWSTGGRLSPDIGGLAGLWPMNRSWEDTSGNGNHGVASAAHEYTTLAKTGSGSSVFDGDSARVDIGSLGTIHGIEFWIDAANASDAVMTLGTAGNPAIVIEDGHLAVSGTWPQKPAIYVNGVQGATRLLSGWNHVALSTDTGITANDVVVGRVGTQYFEGRLDQMAAYRRPLSLGQAREHYLGGRREVGGRTRLQARASDDPTFDDDNLPFRGPGGSTVEYYDDPGSVSLSGVSGRYFQYRLLMESDGQHTPAVGSVTITYNGSETLRHETTSDFMAGDFGGTTVWYGERIGLVDRAATGPLNTDAGIGGVRGLWHLDEAEWIGSGSVQDSSGLGRHGSPSGNARPSSNSRVGSHAGRFDGVNSYISLSAIAELEDGDFSVGAWFRTESDQRAALISTYIAAGSPHWTLEINGNGLGSAPGRATFVINDSVHGNRRAISTRSDLNNGQWHHIAGIRHGRYLHLYINGERAGTDYLGADYESVGSSPPSLARYGSQNVFFDGYLDEVLVVQRALAPGEIGELAAAGIRATEPATFTGPTLDAGQPAIWQFMSWRTMGPHQAALETGAESLLALFHLNESSGPVTDATGNLGDGDVTGATHGVAGRFGSACLEFDGSGDVVTIPHSALLNPPEISMEAWILPGALDDRVIICKRSSANNGFLLGADGNSHLFFEIDGDRVTAGHPGRADVWSHVAGTYDGVDLRLYVNGRLLARAPSDVALGSSAPLRLGRGFDGSGDFLGRIEEVALYDRALTPAEIADHYRSGATTVKLQGRSWDGDPESPQGEFVGPGGSNDLYFTQRLGEDLTDAIQLGQYFQYRVTLASEDHRFAPLFRGISVDMSSYASDSPWIRPTAESAAWFPGRILGFSHDIIPGPRTDVQYQISGDPGATPVWYYWDPHPEVDEWLVADGGFGYPLETSPIEDIQSGITHFYDQFYDKTGGYLRFRAFLYSEGDQQIALEQVGFQAAAGRLTLTFPNGDEVGPHALVVGVPYDIQWTSEDSVADDLTIELWRDSGQTFDRTLATGVGDTGVYRTVISEDVRDDYRIRIFDAQNPDTIYDRSDGDFETVQDLRLTRPNGGEHWYIGQTNRVTWDSWGVGGAELGDRVSLWFSDDDGQTWHEITAAADRPANQVGNNAFDWLTPTNQARLVSEQARMGVSTPGAPDPITAFYGDTSASSFMMAGIAITYPEAGSGIKMGSEIDILYTAAGVGAGGVRVELYDGVEWHELASGAPSVPGENVFTAVLDAPDPTESALLRITAIDDPLVTGQTPPFVLADINIIRPLGGTPAVRDRWRIGSEQVIRWTAGGAGDRVGIDYSIDAGTNWHTIHENYVNTNITDIIITNTAPWTVEGPPSDNARLRIRSVDQPDLFAVTEPFDIRGVEIVSPNGGETWEFTEVNEVSWLHRSAAGQIDMYITYTDGPTNEFEVLQEGVSIFDGRWDIEPEHVRRPSTMARVMLRARGYPQEYDISDNLFTIRGLSMTHPTNNAVYNLRATQTHGLQWYSARTEDTTAELFYAHDGQDFDQRIYFAGLPFIGNIDAGTSFNRQDWQVPGRLLPSYNARVKVVAGDYESVSDPFTMRGIRVTRPVTGERLDIGSHENVYWEAAGLSANAWSLNTLSLNGMDGPFETVGAGADGTDESYILNRGFLWDIDPDLEPTTNAVIRMSVYTPAADTDVVMYSDPFTLRGIKMRQPDGDAVWTLGDQRSIEFMAAGLGYGAAAVLRYSHDGGATFDTAHPIIDGLNVMDGVNNYSWTVENTSGLTRQPSTNAVIEAVSGAYRTVSEPFRMRGIKVTRPIAADIWAVADGTNTIRWTSVDSSGTYNIELTRWENDTVVHTETIATGVSGAEYAWGMTETSIGEDITITVSDAADQVPAGISERFEIVMEPSIRIVNPAPGDFWKVGSEQTIGWSRGGEMVNDFSVSYSAYPFDMTNLLAQGSFPFDDGLFSATWEPIPNAVGPMRLIVVNRDNPNVAHTFDNFHVAASFEIDAFVGDVYALEPNPVDWTTRGSIEGVDFYYSTDLARHPDSWVKINTEPFTGIAHNQPSRYLWTLPDVRSDTVFFRIQDASYTNRFPATRSGPFDDLGPFEIKYYQITWNIYDSATSNHLNNLSVNDSSGWSASDLSSPVIREYPYGTWDTAWFREYFADKVVFQWHSRPSRSIDVYMDRSEMEPDFRVMANFAYNSFEAVFNIQSWLERGGRIIGTPQSNVIRIYDASGALIDTISSSSPSQGVFWQTWDVRAAEDRLGRTFGNMEVFFARVEIMYSGVTYSSGMTFMLRQAADIGDIPEDYQVRADFMYDTPRTNFNIQSWLEKRGSIVTDADKVQIDIYDRAGDLIAELEQHSSVNGVFWRDWSIAGLGYSGEDQFFANVTITHNGNRYSAGFTFQPRRVVGEEIGDVIDTIDESARRTRQEIADFRDYTADQFTNVIDGIEGLRGDIRDSAATNLAMFGQVLDGIDFLESEYLTVMMPDITNMAARLPAIQDDLTFGLARILTRPPTVEYGSTNTILYRSRPGYGNAVSLSVEPDGPTVNMTELPAVPGIYEYRGLIANWGLGDFIITAEDAQASDRIMVRVVRPGMEELPQMFASVSNDLQRMETLMSSLATLDDITREIDTVADDVQALRDFLDNVAMVDHLDDALADLARAETMDQVRDGMNRLENAVAAIDAAGIDEIEAALADLARAETMDQVRNGMDRLENAVAAIDAAGIDEIEAALADLARAETLAEARDTLNRVDDRVQALEVDIDIDVDTTDIEASLREIDRAVAALDPEVDMHALPRVENILRALADEDIEAALLPRLDALAERLTEVGDAAEQAQQRASAARTQASSAMSAAAGVQQELERANLPAASAMLATIENTLREAKSEIDQIPGAVQVEKYFESLDDMANTIQMMAQSQGFQQWLLDEPGIPGVDEIETEAERIRNINRRIEEMQSELQLLHRLMQDAVHEPIIQESLIGIE